MDVAVMWLTMFVFISPGWVPLVLGAYAIGRKRFGLKTLLVFILIEAVVCLPAAYIGSRIIIRDGS